MEPEKRILDYAPARPRRPVAGRAWLIGGSLLQIVLVATATDGRLSGGLFRLFFAPGALARRIPHDPTALAIAMPLLLLLYPIYGLILDLAARRGVLKRTAWFLVLFHAISVLALIALRP